MFAFLNNAHEANIAVYTTRRTDEDRRDLSARFARSKTDSSTSNPDWRERMAAWEKQVASGQPEWVVVRPEVDEESTGGQKYLPMEDGSFLAQGYAPTKHTRQDDGQDRDRRRSRRFASSCSTIPTCPVAAPAARSRGRRR